MKEFYPDTVTTGSSNIKRDLNRYFKEVSSLLAFFLSFLFSAYTVSAQNCPTSGNHSQNASENTYYPGTQATVTAGSTTTITLGAVPAGYGSTPIAVGDILFIVQMQGAQIFLPGGATPATNPSYGGNNGFGNGFISTGLVAGNMEFAVAASAVPTAGGTLTIASTLTNSYSYSVFGTNGQYTYQIIRVPSFYNINLTGGFSTPVWNGAVGGVTVINAVNQLSLGGFTINAKGAGFRGGGGKNRTGAAGANKYNYYDLSTFNANASKAEGIAGTPRYLNISNTLFDNIAEGYPNGSSDRGAPGNAGGGATDSRPTSNDQNAGGGGGGNGGAGGTGGNGWQSFGYTGGFGGTAFKSTSTVSATYYSPSKLIMGGGGGAGSTNNGTGTPGSGVASGGASGGGLVIISATTFAGTGTIDASGADANNTVINDASGGGGAGGSILIYANSGHSGITAISNGGTGGSNNPKSGGATQHGPGGGGGGGVIYSNAALNGASSVAFGANGLSVGTDGTTNYGAISGNDGVLTQTFPFSALPPQMQICQTIVLPVTIIDFSASYTASNNVLVSWSTSNEINCSHFEVERSENASDFTSAGRVNASQSGSSINNYHFDDYLPAVNASIIYYRLKIVSNDGRFTYSKVVPVKLDQPDSKLAIYPNPVDNYTILSIYSDKQTSGMLRVLDNAGKQLTTKSFIINNGSNSILIDQLGNLSKGLYIVQVVMNNTLYTEKLLKK